MLITKEIEVVVTNNEIKHYENKGYVIPKHMDDHKRWRVARGTKLIIKVEDLPDGSNKRVDVQCDCEDCKKKINTQWIKYKKYIHEDGKYYCLKCSLKLFSRRKAGFKNNTRKIKINKSFKDWCIENNQQNILDLWDYELNKCTPDEISFGTNKKYYFKCSRGLHKSELKRINNIHTNLKIICNQCNSFGQWCIDNNRIDIFKRWSNKNKCDLFDIAYNTVKKYYFDCPKNIHEPELKNIVNFTSGHEGSMSCNKCNSFAQWGYDNIDEDFLNKYWDYKKNNELNIDPWEIPHGTPNKKVWIKCQQKDYHGSYNIRCGSFVVGSRCSYCAGKNIHQKDSLGQHIIDNYGEEFLDKIWSDKNKKSPFEYAPKSDKKVWFKCIDGKHEDSYRIIGNSVVLKFRCPKCNYSKGEEKIYNYLTENKINYNSQQKFHRLVGINNGNLSYDFYLKQYNLLIEYQGEYHDGTVSNQTEEEFKIQIEHDNRKREYAEQHNIKLLEIWYWNFDNIEEILNKELKLVKEVR